MATNKQAPPSRRPAQAPRAAAPTQKSSQVPRKVPSPVSSRPVSAGRGTAAQPARTKLVAAPESIEEIEEVLDETVEAVAEEMVSADYVEGQNDVNAAADDGGDDISRLSTTELDSPARKADAHRGRILEILEWHSEQKGTPAFRIVLHSDDADFDTKMDVYVPRPFEEDIRIDASTLSGVKDEDAGTTNEKMQYAMAIHNKKNDALVDRLRVIWKSEGRALSGLGDTFSDFCAALNEVCADLPVVFTRKPQKDAPQFLEVKDIFSITIVEDPKQQGKLKSFVKAWEPQE